MLCDSCSVPRSTRIQFARAHLSSIGGLSSNRCVDNIILVGMGVSRSKFGGTKRVSINNSVIIRNIFGAKTRFIGNGFGNESCHLKFFDNFVKCATITGCCSSGMTSCEIFSYTHGNLGADTATKVIIVQL